MIILTKDEVLHLHEKLINSTGGLAGVRDIDALESSIINCMQTFDDKDLYPTVIEKSARTAFSICKNHPFIDGNKRTAILAMLVLLEINGFNLNYSQEELAALGFGIADSTVSYEGIVEWIKQHKI